MNGLRRVLVVDDHPVFREGLCGVLNSHSSLTVVGEAASLSEALDKLGLCNPDVLITDLRLGEGSGLDLVAQAREQRPDLLMVVISISPDSADVLTAIESGASGYLTKSASREEILHALSEVLQGRSFLHPEVAHVVFARVRTRSPAPEASLEMTPRESDILKMLCSGCAPREIGDSLFLSVSTVKTHMRNLYRKLGVNNRTQLLLKYLEIQSNSAS